MQIGVGLRGLLSVRVVQVELVEVRRRAVLVELDRALEWFVEHERAVVKGGEAGESIGLRNSGTAARSGLGPAGRAPPSLRGHPFGAERLGAGEAVGVELERGGPAAVSS